MSTIYVYTFEDVNGNPDGYETQDKDEATNYAIKHEMLIICNEYEWTDNYPEECYAPLPHTGLDCGDEDHMDVIEEEELEEAYKDDMRDLA